MHLRQVSEKYECVIAQWHQDAPGIFIAQERLHFSQCMLSLDMATSLNTTLNLFETSCWGLVHPKSSWIIHQLPGYNKG